MSQRLRCVIASRVSTEGQAEEGYSLPEQERILREYCAERGWQIVAAVEDAGVTGVLRERPGLLEINRLVTSGAVDVVLWVRLDRLARKLHLMESLIEQWAGYGVQVRFVDYEFDRTPEGTLNRQIRGVFAEYDYNQIRKRLTVGRTTKARGGKRGEGRIPQGVRIYGYRQISVAESRVIPECAGRDGELVIIPEEAEVVREIFRRYDSGEMAMRGLAQWLNDRGVKTVRGRQWAGTTVRVVLGNETYLGVYEWGKTVVAGRNPSGRQIVVKGPTENRIPIPVPAILTTPDGKPDRSLWERVQKRFVENLAEKRGRPPAKPRPLTGLIHCGSCTTLDGHPLAAVHRDKGQWGRCYYVCNRRVLGNTRPDLAPCCVSVRADRIEPAVYAEALRVTAPGWLAKQAQDLARQRRREEGDMEKRLSVLRRQLADVAAQEDRLLDVMLRAPFSSDATTRKAEELNRRRAVLEEEINATAGQVRRGTDPASAAREAEAWAAAVRRELIEGQDDPARLNAAYRSLLRVTLLPDGPEIRLAVDLTAFLGS